MARSLIVKTSTCRIPDGTLKSNFGDLLRASVLLDCLDDDYLWLTDARSAGLLKYFVPPEKTARLEDLGGRWPAAPFAVVYNVDNHVSDAAVFARLGGRWRGHVWDGREVVPENELIAAMAPYAAPATDKSFQELLVEGMGFAWRRQDYPRCRVEFPERADVGLNWRVAAGWTAKTWPREHWERLAALLSPRCRVSWQEGESDMDAYVRWLGSCRVVVTCETLGLHLASALRKKVVAIVGPMRNNEFPYGRLTLVRPSARECMPCESPTCRTGAPCLREVTPEQVAATVLACL